MVFEQFFDPFFGEVLAELWVGLHYVFEGFALREHFGDEFAVGADLSAHVLDRMSDVGHNLGKLLLLWKNLVISLVSRSRGCAKLPCSIAARAFVLNFTGPD